MKDTFKFAFSNINNNENIKPKNKIKVVREIFIGCIFNKNLSQEQKSEKLSGLIKKHKLEELKPTLVKLRQIYENPDSQYECRRGSACIP